ncbi:MAG TPA: hypothetical protein VGQ71_13230 [Terriglobales bacterium]|jgi:hypothetical protein|nr:hypothetical protein [Terriglobales bacterium]
MNSKFALYRHLVLHRLLMPLELQALYLNACIAVAFWVLGLRKFDRLVDDLGILNDYITAPETLPSQAFSEN